MSIALKEQPAAGFATEAQRRAKYGDPDNFFMFAWPKVPRRQFLAERDQAYDRATPTSVIPLAASDAMQLGYVATTPSLLCGYVRLKAGEALPTRHKASGEVFYAMLGGGSTAWGGTTIEWGAGDVMCLPGGGETVHRAGREDALLFFVNNQPLLAFENLEPPAPGNARIKPTHWLHAEIERRFEKIWARQQTAQMSGFAVQFSSPELTPTFNTIPMVNTAINTLHAGGDQRPHRHNGVAVTLAIHGDDIYSMIEDEQVPWSNGAAQITPAAELHSHHNRGSGRMRSFVVQDEGLHHYLRTPGFSWN